jgi:hypothetical protein
VAIAPITKLFAKDRLLNSCVTYGASYLDILQGKCRRLFEQLLNGLRIPGIVRDYKIADPVNNQIIIISVGALFTRISVNGRDYYFHRLTGKYDGMGLAWGAPNPPSDDRPDCIQESPGL